MKRTTDSPQKKTTKKPKVAPAIGKNFVADLPNELVYEILSYLNEHELRWARLIDMRVFRVVNMSNFKIGVVIDSEMSDLTRVFGRYSRPIGLIFRKPAMIKSNIGLLSELTQLTLLDTNDCHWPLKLEKLTNLQCLATLTQLPDIRNFIRLTNLSFESNYQIPLPPHIKCLKMKDAIVDPLVNNDFFPHIRLHLTGLEALETNNAISDLPVDTMTALTVLDIHTNHWEYSHLTNLRRLCSGHANSLTTLLPFKLLESVAMIDTFADNYITQLISSKITHLDLAISDAKSLTELTAFSNLLQLRLTLKSAMDITQNIDMTQINLSCLTKLTSLKILVPDAHWKMKNFSACLQLTNLRQLKIKQKNQYNNPMLFPSTSLQRLEISHYYITLIGLTTLYNLTRFDHKSSARLTMIMQQIEHLTALRALTINPNILTDQKIESLSRFEHLTYLDCKARDGGASVTCLTRLHELKLYAHKAVPNLENQFREKLIYCSYKYETDQ